MSKFGFLSKPPVLVAIVVLIALVGLTSGLRTKMEVDDPQEKVEGTDFDRLETGPARISKINAPSAKVAGGQSTANRAPLKAKTKPREQIVENFDTAQARATGDSYISGRIFTMDDSNGERREWGRDRENDNQTSGGERDRGRDGRRSRSEDSNASAPQTGFTFYTAQSTTPTSNTEDRSRENRSPWGNMKPVEAAEILLYEADPNTTHPPLRIATTDKEGSFTISNINAANQRYIVVAKATDLAPEATFVSLNDAPRDDVFMRLGKGVPISGRVLDAETSAPIAGAVVYHPNPRGDAFSVLGVTTTSLNGSFTFPNVDPGSLVTQARAEGYATTQANLRAPDDSSIIAMKSGGGSISGVTIDRLTGKPAGGARVWAREEDDISESVISAEDGTFTIKNLPAGEFEVYAVRGMKSESQTIELARSEKVDGLEIILPTPLVVSGQVINSKERRPLEGIKVWYKSAKGAQYRKTNADGRFTFETMAIDEYAILIHEKGYLPVQDKKSTNVEESIVRKVAKGQSSDELLIRLRPVPTVEGHVMGPTRRGNAMQVMNDAEVKLGYVEGRNFHQLETRTDAAGNFFFNLPEGRGQGTILASKNYALDAKDVRVPRDRPVQLNLQRDFMMGQVLLIDESPLDGINVSVSTFVPKERSEGENAHRMEITEMDSSRGGRIFGVLPRGQDVELTFFLPDGETIAKNFPSNRLLDSRPIFVYDPVSKDIVADTTPRQRNNDWGGRWGGRGGDGNNGGQGGQGGRRDGQGGPGQGGGQQPGGGAGQAGNGNPGRPSGNQGGGQANP